MGERIAKTSRILSTYHLFRLGDEVEFRELTDSFGVSKKTAYRDIRALKQAGVLQVRFEKTAGTDHRGAFIPALDLRPIEVAEGEPGRKFLEKIRRLCIFTAALYAVDDNANPIELYRSLFPERTERTRQRDFNELRAIGYALKYVPAFYDDPGYWINGVPDEVDGLETLRGKW